MTIPNRSISNNQVSGTIPSSIGSPTKLWWLYVDGSNHLSPNTTSYNLSIYLVFAARELHMLSCLQSLLVVIDDIQQVHLQQSNERHHSIIDWISLEASELVRRIEATTSTSITDTSITQRDTHSMI